VLPFRDNVRETSRTRLRGATLQPNATAALAGYVAMDRLPYQQAFTRVHAEFLEMPGLRLTAAEVGVLCGVDRTICETVLADLTRAGLLYRRDDGTYTRSVHSGEVRVRRDAVRHTPRRLSA